jgi:hypothetical protein
MLAPGAIHSHKQRNNDQQKPEARHNQERVEHWFSPIFSIAERHPKAMAPVISRPQAENKI